MLGCFFVTILASQEDQWLSCMCVFCLSHLDFKMAAASLIKTIFSRLRPTSVVCRPKKIDSALVNREEERISCRRGSSS